MIISLMPVVGGVCDADNGSICAVVVITGVEYNLLLCKVVLCGCVVFANTVANVCCSALGSLIIPIFTSNMISCIFFFATSRFFSPFNDRSSLAMYSPKTENSSLFGAVG